MTQVRNDADEAEYPPTAATSIHSPHDDRSGLSSRAESLNAIEPLTTSVSVTKLEMDKGYAWAVLAAAFVAGKFRQSPRQYKLY